MGTFIRDLIEYHGISTCKYSNLQHFTQKNQDNLFCLPCQNPDIEQVTKVWVDGCVDETEIIKTPKGTSLEGQHITGYKLLVCGRINLKIQYVACDVTQSVHTARTEIPFCEYVVLPEDINPNSFIKASIIIEDILSQQMDLRCIYNNITMMVVVDVC